MVQTKQDGFKVARRFATKKVKNVELLYCADGRLASLDLGNGGQRMTIVKPIGLVAVIHAGNYNKRTAWKVPVSVITRYIVPALGLD